MSKHILLMRGLPASGKSTYARQLVEKHGHYRRISRDLLREMTAFGKWSESREKYIRQAELALAELFLNAGLTPVIDDTNLSPTAMSMWQEFAVRMGASLEIKDFTDVSKEVCKERDRKRPHYVGEAVIERMYREYLAPRPPVIAYDPMLPDAIIVDIDGTLALHHGRNPYDTARCEEDLVNEPVAAILDDYRHRCPILLVSGRSEEYRPQTERWLAQHDIRYLALYMRPSGDNRKDAIVKKEIYELEIEGRYNIKFVLDDRTSVVNLWRSLGLLTLQVAEGDF